MQFLSKYEIKGSIKHIRIIKQAGTAPNFGHPLGMSGTRILQVAINKLIRSGGRYALATMCVVMGYATILENCFNNRIIFNDLIIII
ncbi:hypothetical protein [Maribacter caenipelagi]|uniref:hypothetical protein n=1 Tax=Maribacter caenipelagi TaxID=1447781 RepID=UPI0021D2A9B4|nr:hypothetical protein [Maribacter caenipelagi]